MNVSSTKKFKKQYSKLHVKIQDRFDSRVLLFMEDPTNRILRVHSLKGRYKDYYSIDISGDIRAIYTRKEDGVIFEIIGTHSELYG